MIADVVAKIREQLHATLAADGEKLPTIGVGAAFAATFKSKPSIAFVPISETTSKARAATTDDDEPIALWDRRVEMWTRIYADDVTACEALANRLAAAMEASLTRASHGVIGADWDTSGATAGGQIMVLKLWLGMPFTAEPLTKQTVLTAPTTAGIRTQV